MTLPRRGYLPGAPTDVMEKLAASGMILETGPVPVTEIARRSRLVLNAGQHGILSLGLYAGLPQVCLPQHQEQLWHARAAEKKGVARVVRHVVDDDDLPPVALIDAVHSVYADRSMFDTAVDLSHRLREGLDSDPDTITARTIRPLIAPLLNPVSAAEPRR
ncbi:hypothetical protein [Pseudotabrizicola sp.]|uniref:hypothetical protein n=1 Tax=Pseudotabrizicola sp. TaxID=2939647 RepID=UPI002726ED45|nr:hypothetical protein [Pseudotabrizicola sp.]MDO8884152.1 hypothetical protein [Pseudotabrizicola sp.]